MSKNKRFKKQQKWKMQENHQTKIQEQHQAVVNTGFEIITDKEVSIEEDSETQDDEPEISSSLILPRSLLGGYNAKPTVEEFDKMYKLISDKYPHIFLDIHTLINIFEKDFGFITNQNEICDYLDVTLGDDIEDRKILMNLQGYNVDID